MFVFEQKQIINNKLDYIFPFFSKPENLSTITPNWLKFKIKTKPPLVMKNNAKFDYVIKFFGVPMKWTTVITDYNPPFMFEGTQTKGPYKLWVHTHSFSEENGKTIMHDCVEYDLYGGPLKYLINSLFVKKSINKIFAFRKEIIKKRFE